MTTSRQGSGTSGFVSGLQDAIQQNPVSAALIGMGVLWMLTGGKNITAAAALFPAAAKATAAGAASGLQRSAEVAGDAGEAVRSFGATVIDGVRDTVSGAAASAGETATKAYEAVKDTAAEFDRAHDGGCERNRPTCREPAAKSHRYVRAAALAPRRDRPGYRCRYGGGGPHHADGNRDGRRHCEPCESASAQSWRQPRSRRSPRLRNGRLKPSSRKRQHKA